MFADGEYDYQQIKNWVKKQKVPEGNVFLLDKLIVPGNVTATHWTCTVAYVQQKVTEIPPPPHTHHHRAHQNSRKSSMPADSVLRFNGWAGSPLHGRTETVLRRRGSSPTPIHLTFIYVCISPNYHSTPPTHRLQAKKLRHRGGDPRFGHLLDMDSWTIQTTIVRDNERVVVTPQQDNGYDCGVNRHLSKRDLSQ